MSDSDHFPPLSIDSRYPTTRSQGQVGSGTYTGIMEDQDRYIWESGRQFNSNLTSPHSMAWTASQGPIILAPGYTLALRCLNSGSGRRGQISTTFHWYELPVGT